MDPRIQSLMDRLAELPELEKELRLESNSCAFPIMLENGKVEMKIADPGRLKEIREELAAIAEEREAIHDKINKLSELLGPAMVIHDPDRNDGYVARQRSTFVMRFADVVCRGHGMTRTPEEALRTEEYKKLKEEFQPELDKYADMKQRDEELAAAAYQILNA